MTENLSPLKQAFLAIEELQAKLEAAQQSAAFSNEPIAVIGMGCRFPGGANDPQTFWENLRGGVDAIRDIPADRWDVDAYYHPDPDAPGKSYLRQAGFLDQVDAFDPQFFGIAPREAHAMDPQQRLLLEVAWEALENAAIAPDSLNGSRTGVFVGIASSDYANMVAKSNDPAQFDTYYASGIAHSIASGRLAYVLGLQGPAVSVDTACSSSLLATHLAVQSLRSRDSDMALAAGVNLILQPDNQIGFSRLRMVAADGRCKTFDARADGFGDGEGCGVVVLKRLADAQRDGDRILAVIRGTAANQDGASSGLTAPNGPAQEAVIRAALANGGVRPDEVGYVEAHGTGTALGDPIEVRALANVLRANRPEERPFLLGSVKTNIGHLEAGAGIAGLIKTVLALQHGEVPPHLHFETPNPLLAWDEIPARIPTTPTPWLPGYQQRVAGISAFGFSGTNVHVVLQAAPQPNTPDAPQTDERPLHLMALSARNEAALLALTGRYVDMLAQPENAHRFADVAYTANTGRARLAQRLAVLAPDSAAAREKLARFIEQGDAPGLVSGQIERSDPPKIAFLFTGQGAQYAGMGRQLYETQPTFRAALDQCETIYRAQTGESLLAVIYPDDVATADRVNQTGYTQPALFAIEYALAQMWMVWGIQPAAVAGHSLGEYVAALLAGIFSLEDALKLVTARGRLMGALPAGGGMTAIFAPADAVQAAINAQPGALGRVAIAAVNAPDNTVISGEQSAVQAVASVFQAQGVRTSALKVSHAFHSHLVTPMLDEFERVAASVAYSPPKLRLVSDVTGEVARGAALANPRYWRDHVQQPVQFQRTIETLYREGCDILLEVGPHPVLTGMGQRTLADPQRPLTWVSTLKRDQDDWQQVLGALAQLFVAGAPVDWNTFDQPYPRRRLVLPTYPFQRARYWLERKPAQTVRASGAPVHPLLGEKLRSPARSLSFQNRLRAADFAFLDDHRVFGAAILPATGFIELALAAGRESFGQRGFDLEDFSIHAALRLADAEERLLHTLLTPAEDGAARLEIYSQGAVDDPWTLHAAGQLTPVGLESLNALESIAAIQARCARPRSAEAHYQRLSGSGLTFGESLKGVVQIHCGEGEALGEIQPTPAVQEEDGYLLHPALLDAHLQVIAAAMPDSDEVYLPIHIARLRRFSAAVPAWSHVRLAQPAGRETVSASLTLLDEQGAVVAQIEDVTLKRADRASLQPRASAVVEDWLYEITWQPDTNTTPSGGKLSPRQLAQTLDPALDRLYAQNALEAYVTDLSPEFDRLARMYITNALRELGWQPQPGETFSAAGLAETLKIVPQHRRLIGYLLKILAEDGYIAAQGEEWRVLRAPQPEDAAGLHARLMRVFPEYSGELEITARCGAQLAAALSGSADPLQLLFPGGSLETAERIYQKSPSALAYNGLVREAVAGILAQRGGNGLRVLEIGAGTGGTTNFVLPILPGDSQYTFTDISPLFVARAQQKFSAYPFVRYQPLDIEKDPGAQGLDGQRFDLVIAANVIHATQDLRVTLRHVRQLLAPGGIFIMLEVTAPQRWVDITFGLTDGWWRFTDRDLRPTYPLLARPAWVELLESAGFAEAVTIPQAGADIRGSKIEQAVIIASAASQTAGRWLLVGDPDDAARAALAARLEQQGALCTLASDTTESLAREVGQAAPEQIVFLGGNLRALLAVTQAAAASANPPRLWLVTRGAQPAFPWREPDPAQAAVWGFARGIALEHPELRPVRIDLAPGEADPAGTLLPVIQSVVSGALPEEEIALRGGQTLLARLSRAALPTASNASTTRLVQERPGTLDGLAWQPQARVAPAAGQVEIHVQASGLNFKDLMIALDMAPPAPLGMECAGVISAIGEGVNAFAVGDPVMAIVPGGFAGYALADAALTARIPANLGVSQAAAQLVAFITAAYALEHLGRMQAGDRVLIHAGAGGVGQAAIQLARRAGAEIFATAGTPEKRDLLRSLGAAHVFDSRSLDFAGEIRRITGGRGVDLALNSLAGDFIPATLGIMAAGGRFLEIGKSGLLNPQQAARDYPALRYHVIDWSEQLQHDPGIIVNILQSILADLSSGALQPLPVRVFAADEAQAAFRFMQQARHAGRIVLTQPNAASAPLARPDATYLVTGGLRGIGLLTAEWLAEQGACHLALLGRSAPAPEAQETLQRLQARGVTVRVIQGDVSREADVTAALDQIATGMPPLRGVIHAAGVLDDAALLNQTWERFESVLAPKARGAEILHRLSLARALPLDFFVLYSSVASVFGSRGQANHSAANAHMDALAHTRRARGLPALSINWGVWNQVGAAVDRGAVERSAAKGMLSFTPAEGLAALDRLMRSPAVQVTVSPMDWAVYLPTYGENPPPLLRGMAAEAARAAASARSAAPQTSKSSSTARASFLRELKSAPAERQPALLLNFVQAQAARVLGLEPRAVLEHTPLSEMGLDSLMAVELRNLLGKALELERPLPVTMVFDYPTITAMRDYLAAEVLRLTAGQPAPVAAQSDSGMLDNIEDLSDEDVEKLIGELKKGTK